MTTLDNEAIYADAALSATLRNAGSSIACLTLQEAVIAWHKLSATDREQATIKSGGAVYGAHEILRLHNSRAA
jgi:hypothetical protein